MTINLTPEQERRIQAVLSRGAYESVEEVVEAALTAVEQRTVPICRDTGRTGYFACRRSRVKATRGRRGLGFGRQANGRHACRAQDRPAFVKVLYRQSASDDVVRQFRYYLVTINLPEVAVRFRDAVRRTVIVTPASPCRPALFLRAIRNFKVCARGRLRDLKPFGFINLLDEDAIDVLRGFCTANEMLNASSNAWEPADISRQNLGLYSVSLR